MESNKKLADKIEELLRAAYQGDVNIVQTLLDDGVDKEVKTVMGSTPLFMAAQNGHSEVVDLLLKKGANPEVKGVEETTPLFMAAQNGHSVVVDLLLKHGANAAIEVRGKTALTVARDKGHKEIEKLLEESLRTVASPSTALEGSKDVSRDHKDSPSTSRSFS